MKVLIMGLPTSGKTTLASEIVKRLREKEAFVVWYNADHEERKVRHGGETR